MVKSAPSAGQEQLANPAFWDALADAIDQLVRSGADPDRIVTMVADRVNARRVTDANDIAAYLDAAEAEPGDVPPKNVDYFAQGEIIYEHPDHFIPMPEGLIDLPSAARKYDINVRVIRNWAYLGKIPIRGRRFAPAAGGGYLVTEEAAIPYCRDNPRKPGPKPRK